MHEAPPSFTCTPLHCSNMAASLADQRPHWILDQDFHVFIYTGPYIWWSALLPAFLKTCCQLSKGAGGRGGGMCGMFTEHSDSGEFQVSRVSPKVSDVIRRRGRVSEKSIVGDQCFQKLLLPCDRNVCSMFNDSK